MTGAQEMRSTGPGDQRNTDTTTILTSLALASLVVFAFFVLKNKVHFFTHPAPGKVNLAIALALLGTSVSARHLPVSFRVLFIYLNTSLLFYLIASYKVHELLVGHLAVDLKWIPILAAVLAYWRPSLAILAIMAVQWNKTLVAKDMGFALTSTDYMVAIEIGVLLCLFVVAVSLARLSSLAIGRIAPNRAFNWRALAVTPLQHAVIVVAAVHLSNYFYSGVQKLYLTNAGPFDWVLDNQTYLLTAITSRFEYLNAFSIPGLPATLYLQLAAITPALNFIVLVSQLIVVAAIFSRRASIAVTALFDIMHAMIFALTSIFFWKWILLNLGFVHALTIMRRSKERLPLPVGIYAAVLLLAAPLVFQIAKLGWFETGGVNYAHIQVETREGRRIEVPTNFFLEKSVTFAQQRIGRPFNGHLPTHDWGTTMDRDIAQRLTGTCQPPEPLEPALDPAALVRTSKVLKKHHARVLTMAGERGNIAYDFYPHHIWSSPFGYAEFKALDLRTVVAYHLVVESFCVHLGPGGEPVYEDLTKGEHRFPLDG